MSYLVFARKYRPQSFEDVVAQEHVTRTLRNALKNDRIGSGYLFCGPRGTGKTTVARLLAKSINCINGPTPEPCNECPACKEITAGNSLDVLEIDAASNTGVDDMRTLRENVRYLPTSGKKRIYIIDEVHRLSGSAFDALLKTLEEPPEHVMFMMATTEPLKVPDTILSRTQRFDFRRVSLEDLAGHLKNIAEKENLKIDDAALRILARKADGSVRDSLSLLDQIAAFAGRNVTEQDVVSALGLVDRQFLFDFVEAVAAKDRRKVLHLLKGLFDSGVEITDFVTELLEHFRCLMLLKSDPDGTGLLDLAASEIDEYKKQADYFKIGDILRLLNMTGGLYNDLRSGMDERLLLETTGVKMAEMESTVKFEEILAHLKDQPSAAEASSAPPPAGQTGDMFGRAQKKSEDPTTPAPVAAPAPEPAASKAINMPQVISQWDSYVTVLRRSSPMLASQIRMAELRSVKDNQLHLFFAASGKTSLQLVTKPENIKIITQTLRDHYKANLSVAFDIDPKKQDNGEDEDKKKEPKVDPKELVARSPRLKSLLERVDGEIIGIRKADD